MKNPLSVILHIVGALLIIGGIAFALRVNFLSDERENLKDTYIETQGVIDTIDISTEGGAQTVYAHYEVDGKRYENVKINDYPATVRIGDTVSIWYDPEHPEIYINNPGTGMVLIQNFISLVILIFGFVILILAGRMTKSRAEQRQNLQFKSYEDYGGKTTERAGTLFNREVDPKELELDDKKIL